MHEYKIITLCGSTKFKDEFMKVQEAFLSLKGKSKEEQEKIRHGLLVYCELDTYSMVKIWMIFNEIIGGERYE